MIMATIPDRKSTITNEFIMLGMKENNNTRPELVTAV